MNCYFCRSIVTSLWLLQWVATSSEAWTPTAAHHHSGTKSTSSVVGPLSRLSLSLSEECPVDEDDAVGCLLDNGYSSVTEKQESFALVTQVVVAPVESLRDSFPSFESAENGSEGSNMIKFNKRKRRGSHVLMNALHKTDEVNNNGDAVAGKNGDSAAPPTTAEEDNTSYAANLEYNHIVDDDELILVDTVRNRKMTSISRAFMSAGPRKYLHFDPSKVNAAVVTCGGLCPGLNNVIREVVRSLYYLYGANSVWGVQGGYNGFHKESGLPPIRLTNELVENIHHKGGTILRSSRGGFDIDKIIAFCKEYDVQQLYIIGGDGTHRGAYAIHQACQQRRLNLAVAAIPKTIDNDIALIDRSFGFQSAVEAALAAIDTAHTEATCFVPNGIGLVKLMGRSAGFLAAFAALGNGNVDAVLVPEVPLVLEGPDGILPFLRQRIKEKGYVVVVAAEGAGEDLIGFSDEVDKGGNRKFRDIGSFLKERITDYFKGFGEQASMKYVDPSYMVRSVPANGADAMYCMQLAQDAVHGAMAGMTGFSTGLINRSPVYVPIPQLVAKSPRQMDPYGKVWQEVLTMTGQPNTATPRVDMDEDFIVDEVVEGLPSGIAQPIIH